MASGRDARRNRKRPADMNENSPVIKAFRGYQAELDSKHDRYERIVKLSRDITIESKRIIFLLQRCAGSDPLEKEDILKQAQIKLKEVQQAKFLPVALELEGHDHYQFIRAYSPGLQEYIEALSFYYFLKDGQLITLTEVEKDLQFPRPTSATTSGDDQPNPASQNLKTALVVSQSSSATLSGSDAQKKTDDITLVCTPEVNKKVTETLRNDQTIIPTNNTVIVTIPPTEFMLGIADLTGELMRTAIMSVSAGNLDYPVQICHFMRTIHDAFMSYGNTVRELVRKMTTLRQSLQKVENACYTLKVRGSEIPQHMLSTIFASTTEGQFAEDIDDPSYD